MLDYLFFEKIKKYLSQSGKVNEPIFAEKFLTMYIQMLARNSDSDISSLWDHLSNWRITRHSIEGDASTQLSRRLLQAYINTILNKAHGELEFASREAKIIELVTENLMPKINPILWFNVITFYANGWGLEEGEDSLHAQIRNYVEKGRNFGITKSSGLINLSDHKNESPEKMREDIWISQDKETMYILGIIYPWLINPKEIQKVINMAVAMKREERYSKGDIPSLRLDGLLSDFESILEFANNEKDR
jgi:hypothetical protein